MRASARVLLTVVGTVSLGLGIIGGFVPLLPTTPFLLLSAACYAKSSTRLYWWLLKNRWFGEYIRDYREGRGVPLRSKVLALAVLWLTVGSSAAFFLPLLALKVALVAIALAVSVRIATLPTRRR